MSHKYTKKDFLTIPNALSLFRLCLVPLLIWVYCVPKEYIAAVCIIALSALTDIVDGKIARKFNMVSDVGKALDPLADKITQGALIFCLATRYSKIWYLVGLFIFKELFQLFLAYLTFHFTGSVNSAKWYGKACTVVLDTSMAFLVIAPNPPSWLVNALLILCGLCLAAALVLYTAFFFDILKSTSLWLNHQKAWTRAFRIFVLCAWAGVILFCILNRDKFSVDGVVRFSPGNLFFAAVVLWLLFALKSLSIVMYNGILYAASGLLFPLPVAILVNIAGTAIMVSLPYFIAGKYGQPAIDAFIHRHPKISALRDVQKKNDFFLVLFVRLTSFLPCDLVSMYFGAVKMPYPKYLLACILGMLPPAITFPILGTNVSNPGSPAFLIAAGVELLFVLVSLIVSLVFRKGQKKKEGTPDHENSEQNKGEETNA